jgi:REP element-mobilizing transposase RayT
MKGYYRRNLPHLEKFHAAYFVTFRTFEVFLPPLARTIALRHCIFEHGRRVEMHAAVIMPNHVHLLLTPFEADEGEPFPLAKIMKGIKGVSARRINQWLGRKGSLWQDESFDRIMRAREFEFKRNYIMANPVDAGLCKRPEEYRWLWLQKETIEAARHEPPRRR